MAHFTAFQEPYEHKTLLILPSVNNKNYQSCCMFLRKKKHYQKYGMNMIITMNYRTSTRSGSYNKKQLTNDQIRST